MSESEETNGELESLAPSVQIYTAIKTSSSVASNSNRSALKSLRELKLFSSTRWVALAALTFAVVLIWYISPKYSGEGGQHFDVVIRVPTSDGNTLLGQTAIGNQAKVSNVSLILSSNGQLHETEWLTQPSFIRWLRGFRDSYQAKLRFDVQKGTSFVVTFEGASLPCEEYQATIGKNDFRKTNLLVTITTDNPVYKAFTDLAIRDSTYQIACNVEVHKSGFANRRLEIGYGGLWDTSLGQVYSEFNDQPAQLRLNLERLNADADGTLRLTGGAFDNSSMKVYGEVDDAERFLEFEPGYPVAGAMRNIVDAHWDSARLVTLRDVIGILVGALLAIAAPILLEWLVEFCRWLSKTLFRPATGRGSDR